MSKQSEAKERQNYRNAPNSCVNCLHFKSEEIEKTVHVYGGPSTWKETKNMRCGIGGFAVKKMSVCEEHILNPQTQDK